MALGCEDGGIIGGSGGVEEDCGGGVVVEGGGELEVDGCGAVESGGTAEVGEFGDGDAIAIPSFQASNFQVIKCT